MVNRDGFLPDPQNIRLSSPEKSKQLRRFLCMTSYYRKFVKDLATVNEALTCLANSKVTFTWGEEQQQAFDDIKACIACITVLYRPSIEHEFVTQADASDSGIGGVLTQTQRHGMIYLFR